MKGAKGARKVSKRGRAPGKEDGDCISKGLGELRESSMGVPFHQSSDSAVLERTLEALVRAPTIVGKGGSAKSKRAAQRWLKNSIGGSEAST